MLKKTELAEFKTLLLTLQARLRGDVQHLADGALRRADGDGDSKSPTHIAELGTDNYEQDFSLRFVENEQEILDEISLALKRIDEGTFGLCEKCLAEGKPPAKSTIIKERLKAIPYVRTCVSCADKQRTRKWRR
jgi:DnaK suppressor protein